MPGWINITGFLASDGPKMYLFCVNHRVNIFNLTQRSLSHLFDVARNSYFSALGINRHIQVPRRCRARKRPSD